MRVALQKNLAGKLRQLGVRIQRVEGK